MKRIKKEFVQKVISHINKKDWWHVPPLDPLAYSKRGKFFSSSFRDAEFYGRPLDDPEHVTISSPLLGDEATIEAALFGKPIEHPEPGNPGSTEFQLELDARMKRVALSKGYDSIVLMTPKEFVAYKAQGKMPRSIELNVLEP
jgi:hypothetical protein